MTLTPEQFAQRSLDLQEATLAEAREQTRLIRRLCAALAVNTKRAVERAAQAQAEQHAAAGAFAASQLRRRGQRKAG